MKISIELSKAPTEQLELYSENIEKYLLSIENVSEITVSMRNAVLMELQSRGRVKSVGDPITSINHPEFIVVCE